MSVSLIRRVPLYDLLADDNLDATWQEFVDLVGDEDEVWECRFMRTSADLADDAPLGLVLLREGVEIATFPPTPQARSKN
jgi:hypothetical protein